MWTDLIDINSPFIFKHIFPISNLRSLKKILQKYLENKCIAGKHNSRRTHHHSICATVNLHWPWRTYARAENVEKEYFPLVPCEIKLYTSFELIFACSGYCTVNMSHDLIWWCFNHCCFLPLMHQQFCYLQQWCFLALKIRLNKLH